MTRRHSVSVLSLILSLLLVMSSVNVLAAGKSRKLEYGNASAEIFADRIEFELQVPDMPDKFKLNKPSSSYPGEEYAFWVNFADKNGKYGINTAYVKWNATDKPFTAGLEAFTTSFWDSSTPGEQHKVFEFTTVKKIPGGIRWTMPIPTPANDPGISLDTASLQLTGFNIWMPDTGDEPAPVKAVKSVKLNKSKASMEIGKTVQLKATVNPNNATDKSVIWSSNNDLIATVSETGLVTAIAPGTATITATANNGKSAKCKVTVKPIKVKAVAISGNPEVIALDEEAVYALVATTNSDATNQKVKWTSSNKKIAKIDPATGVITPIKAGKVKFTATATDGSKKKASCSVKIVKTNTLP